MIVQILFIVTAVICILLAIKLTGAILGNGVGMPLPLLHVFDVSVSNVYIMYPSVGFQVWFWTQPLFV